MEAKAMQTLKPFDGSRHVGWKSPSNIALIKYWGKSDYQLPRNPSLSFTLSNSFTETSVEYSYTEKEKPATLFVFEGKPEDSFKNRIEKYRQTLVEYMPFLNHLDLKIESVNSFPHSSGIASSASGMSALALCLTSIEQRLYETPSGRNNFMNKASFLARLGSGSAARSVYGDFVCWGEHAVVEGSTDEAAVQIAMAGKDHWELGDAILITSSDKKQVSSSVGHGLMDQHPYAEARYEQARNHIPQLLEAMESNLETRFQEIVENEALSLHALMMNSNPGFTLMNPQTWSIIQAIRNYRKERRLFMAFTLDAGPNVHLIYRKKDKQKILDFIDNELIQYCENGYWIDDEMGGGPVELN
jgi:diphosphomevalonate decarboxylase